MPLGPRDHYIAGFGANQWTGNPAKGSGKRFFRSGFLTFIVCLWLMIFVEPFRNFFVIVGVCTAVAMLAVWSSVAPKVKAERTFLAGLTGRVNEAILELTGDPTARIPAGELRQLIQDSRRRVPLHINGVPGVWLKVVPGAENEATRVVASLTPPDYGLESFDVLLNAEQRKP